MKNQTQAFIIFHLEFEEDVKRYYKILFYTMGFDFSCNYIYLSCYFIFSLPRDPLYYKFIK